MVILEILHAQTMLGCCCCCCSLTASVCVAKFMSECLVMSFCGSLSHNPLNRSALITPFAAAAAEAAFSNCRCLLLLSIKCAVVVYGGSMEAMMRASHAGHACDSYLSSLSVLVACMHIVAAVCRKFHSSCMFLHRA